LANQYLQLHEFAVEMLNSGANSREERQYCILENIF
jgi:hypothetical protein